MSTRYGASRAEYETWLTEHGHPRYRAQQVWDALYTQRRPLETTTNLPAALRNEIAAAFPLSLSTITEQQGDRGMTRKMLYGTRDSAQIETVLMISPNRATVCVSSQAGCAMGCTFCATGQAGFERQLDTDEIIEQILVAGHGSPQPVTNVGILIYYFGNNIPCPLQSIVNRLHVIINKLNSFCIYVEIFLFQYKQCEWFKSVFPCSLGLCFALRFKG